MGSSDRWSGYNRFPVTVVTFPSAKKLYGLLCTEPANNIAEQKVRPGVLWRKVSFGTQRDVGSRFAERMMSVVATLKQQDRNVLDYFVEASEAVYWDKPAHSLTL